MVTSTKSVSFMASIAGGRDRLCGDWHLEEALARYGKPDIFNTDQGRQFTGGEFIGVLKNAGVKISMDGRGRWMDNVFIERLWRAMKYECVYLHAFETGSELRQSLAKWISFYNTRRPHSVFAGWTPDDVSFQIATTPSPGHALETVSSMFLAA